MNKAKKVKSQKQNIRKVLFVCNANVFRSYSAEALLKQYLTAHHIKGWGVFSAGVIAKKEAVDPEVLADLKALGVKDLRHKQHKLSKALLKKYDLVIAMAQDQVDFMKNNFNFNHAILFNELVRDDNSSIWDVENEVKDPTTDRVGVERKIDRTIKYIHDNIPKLVEGINERVYLFSDFVGGLRKRKHSNGFPVIKLYETQNTFAFMSISIPSKEDGHILVIPKERYIFLHEIPPKILGELLLSIQKIGEVLERDHGGYNVLINNGRAAGQYIFHSHFHLLPRDVNDKINLNGWISKKMTAQQFVKFNNTLKKKIDSKSA